MGLRQHTAARGASRWRILLHSEPVACSSGQRHGAGGGGDSLNTHVCCVPSWHHSPQAILANHDACILLQGRSLLCQGHPTCSLPLRAHHTRHCTLHKESARPGRQPRLARNTLSSHTLLGRGLGSGHRVLAQWSAGALLETRAQPLGLGPAAPNAGHASAAAEYSWGSGSAPVPWVTARAAGQTLVKHQGRGASHGTLPMCCVPRAT
jgi:hypothetical protein